MTDQLIRIIEDPRWQSLETDASLLMGAWAIPRWKGLLLEGDSPLNYIYSESIGLV